MQSYGYPRSLRERQKERDNMYSLLGTAVGIIIIGIYAYLKDRISHN